MYLGGNIKQWCGLLLFVCHLLIVHSAIAAGTAPIAPNRFSLVVESVEAKLPYSSNHPIDVRNESIDRVIIAIHGSEPIAQTYLESAQLATNTVKGTEETTLIVAPQFFYDGSQFEEAIPGDLLFWDVSPFLGSRNALTGSGWQTFSISSFTVLDTLLTAVTNPDLFPNLKSIIVLGHSAGGQMVNRYAASNVFQTVSAVPRSIQMKYLVMAPSSYLYFSDERVRENTIDQFEAPTGTYLGDCSTYNDYGYGLDHLYAYHTGLGIDAETIRAQYQQRTVLYLVGSDDNDPNDPGLSTTCSSMLQGANRLARARIYHEYLKYYFGTQRTNSHHLCIAQDIGHWGQGLITSEHGLESIFSAIPGDVNNDGLVNGKDLIVALRVLSNLDTGSYVTTTADINGNNVIDLSEVVYILQRMSKL